jgi:hypothetical protein
MKNISLRGIDEETSRHLKKEAARQRTSVNTLILGLVRQGMGLAKEPSRRPVHHDLDALAGTWSEEEAASFLNATKDFEEIDKDLWK